MNIKPEVLGPEVLLAPSPSLTLVRSKYPKKGYKKHEKIQQCFSLVYSPTIQQHIV